MDEQFKLDLLTRRGWACEHCHARRATDLHHALIGRDKRFKKFLDVEENYMIVCHYCHMRGDVDSKEVRKLFWQRQCDRYGKKHMVEWLENLPLKVKPMF